MHVHHGSVPRTWKSGASPWLQGDRVCDVCKVQIANLPEISPRAPTEASEGQSAFDELDERNAGHPGGLHGAFVAEQMPSSADIIFDCIRVRGVVMLS